MIFLGNTLLLSFCIDVVFELSICINVIALTALISLCLYMVIIVSSSACSGDYPINTMRYRHKCCNSVAFDDRVVRYTNNMFLANSFARYGLVMPHCDMFIWFNIGEYIFGSNILLPNSASSHYLDQYGIIIIIEDYSYFYLFLISNFLVLQLLPYLSSTNELSKTPMDYKEDMSW